MLRMQLQPHDTLILKLMLIIQTANMAKGHVTTVRCFCPTFHKLLAAVLTSTHNLCFEQKCEKYQDFFLSEIFQFFGGEIFYIFE